MKAARLAREQQKPLSLEWLAEAARVVPPGPTGLLWVHAPGAMPVMMRYQPLLQFYGSLLAPQRTALETERGLPGDALSDGQRVLLMQSVRHLSRGEPVSAGSQPQIQLARSVTSAAFTIKVGDRTVEATITLPSAQAVGSLPGFAPGAPPAPPR